MSKDAGCRKRTVAKLLNHRSLPKMVVEAQYTVETAYRKLGELSPQAFQDFLRARRIDPNPRGFFWVLPLPLVLFHVLPARNEAKIPGVRTAESWQRRRSFDCLLGAPVSLRNSPIIGAPTLAPTWWIDAFLLLFNPQTCRGSLIALTGANSLSIVETRLARAEGWGGEIVISSSRPQGVPDECVYGRSSNEAEDMEFRHRVRVSQIAIRAGDKRMTSDEIALSIGAILCRDGVFDSDDRLKFEKACHLYVQAEIEDAAAPAEKSTGRFVNVTRIKNLHLSLIKRLRWPYPGSIRCYIRKSAASASIGTSMLLGIESDAGSESDDFGWSE